MAILSSYLRTMGWMLCLLGLAGSLYCWRGVRSDDAYYRAAKALEKHPGNVLYTSEFRIAEPRHMLLVAGSFSAAPLGLVLGGLCIGVGALVSAANERDGRGCGGSH